MDDRIRMGFLLAAAFNIVGVTVMSHGFTNQVLFDIDPGLFGLRGCLLIVVWGLAYASVADRYASVPALVAVFALEKAFYGVTWLFWLSQHATELPTIADKSVTAALFMSGYGAGDWAFCIFFGVVAWRSRS